MQIVVCIKQVPDSDKVSIDRETNRLNRTGVPSIINPFDENALEMALQLRDQHGGKVTVITMGPPQAEEALRAALAVGADDAALITDRHFAGSDTWATSYTLSLAVKKTGTPDLVLFGKQAIDGDTAQVGPGVAHFLDLPIITMVRKLEVKEDHFLATQVTEDGYHLWRVDRPAACSVVKEANTLRMPSLKKKMAAKKAVIPTWTAADLNADPEKVGLKGSPTKVVKIFAPPVKVNKEIISGDVPDMVDCLLRKMKERKIL